MTINLSDNGRIDYKIQWKEEEAHTIEDTVATYVLIRKLIDKINGENNRFGIKLKIPADDEFGFAFINTIQKINLPGKFTFNHNDLSEFARFFFPYIALLIDPRKRQAKIKAEGEEKGKFGTYLRFKRISDYENKTRIEHRILFFIRHYEYDDQSLANEISKEFNLTLEQSIQEINSTREKYPNVKKSRKVLKKLENIPKYKPPGIGVDIQGKQRDKYKMRIAGARDRDQLDRILEFMHIFIYLYAETYLYKRADRQKMKDRFRRITKVAKRRNKVDEFVDYEIETKSIKQLIAMDKARLGYKASETTNSYARDCQNSGEGMRRQPAQFRNVSELLDLGYVWKDKLDGYDFGHYEKTVMVKDETGSNKKVPVVLKAVKMALDETGTDFVYYVCGPKENGKHMYVGFLSKKESVPCCFIKDQFYSANPAKRSLYLKSIGLTETRAQVEKEGELLGDQLYILQDTNKIYENRLSFLPRYLEIFMNVLSDNRKNIKNHYLVDTSGYYFKYGVKTSEFKFLNAVGTVIDLSVESIKQKMIDVLESDRTKSIFTSLNNGDNRTRFGTVEAFISYIKINGSLEYDILHDLLCLPGTLKKNGLNIIIFQKKVRVIKRTLEKEQIRESYYVICQNPENTDNLINPQRPAILLIKDGKSYYPIVLVKKPASKPIEITETFHYAPESFNIINRIYQYYKLNCQSEFNVLVKSSKDSLDSKDLRTEESGANAKLTHQILSKLPKKFNPKSQFVDARFKCRFLITHGEYVIPVMPSGCIYNLPLVYKLDNYIKDYESTVSYLAELDELVTSSNPRLGMKPVGIYYEEKDPKKDYVINSVMVESLGAVPVQTKTISRSFVQNNKLLVQHRPNDGAIDNEISKGTKNKIVDDRLYQVSKSNYELELYQLFRLHLSYFLNNTPIGLKYRERLDNLSKNKSKIAKPDLITELKKILYAICNKKLSKIFNELVQKVRAQIKGGEADKADEEDKETEQDEITEEIKEETIEDTKDKTINKAQTKWVHVLPEQHPIDYVSYEIQNNRELCYENTDKNICDQFQYCHWSGLQNMCMLGVTTDLLVDFINKVVEEFVQNGLKASEVLQRENYAVSTIVSYNVFKEREGERIIMGSHTNIQNILEEIFGKEAIPKIGKRRSRIESIQNYEQINAEHPLKSTEAWYVQDIIDNKNTYFRSFANAYYWLMHPFNDVYYRNLSYYSKLQTELSNVYKSIVIDWLVSKENKEKIKLISSYVKSDIKDFAIKLGTDVVTLTSGIVEFYVLSILYNVIIYIYDELYDIIYVLHPTEGLIYDHKKDKAPFDSSAYYKFKKNINLLFRYISKNIYPDVVEVLYPKE
jgi:hypothetical protein